MRRLTASPPYRVEQKLAFASADRFPASVEVSVRIRESTFQLSDAIDEEAHVVR